MTMGLSALVSNDHGGEEGDAGIKDMLSSFDADRSAVADCAKLAAPPGDERKAILTYSFDAPRRPVALVIDAFAVIVDTRVNLGERSSAPDHAAVRTSVR